MRTPPGLALIDGSRVGILTALGHVVGRRAWRLDHQKTLSFTSHDRRSLALGALLKEEDNALEQPD